MKILSNLTLRTRMTGAFMVILALFAAYCLYSLMEMDRLGELTETIYEHPLRVSNAALRAGAGIIKMDRAVLAAVRAENRLELDEALQTVREEEPVVTENLALIEKQILGKEGQQLHQATKSLFEEWKPLRTRILSLTQHGDTEAALALIHERGTRHVGQLESRMLELNAYARNKADGFIKNAREVQRTILIDSIAAFGFVLLLSSLIAYLILRSILGAVSSLQGTMATISESGNLVQSTLTGRDEIAQMGRHFNLLVDRLQNQFWLRDGVNDLNREISGDLTLEELADKGIGFVSRYVKACAGALYLCDKDSSRCDLKASFALVESPHFARSFTLGEGIVGQVAREQKALMLSGISRAEAVGASGTMSEPPRCICVLPLLYEKRLFGVLEVASYDRIEALQLEFLEKSADIISVTLYTSFQNQKIRDLLEESRLANQALEAKTRALDEANEEITGVNEELVSQSEELKAQAEELRGQTAELLHQRTLVEEADRLKSEFLSNMSHELRTPLNSIMALSQLMISRGVGVNPEQEAQYLQVIERNGRSLLSLINDILDLSKIESGRMDLFLTDFDPNLPVQSALETVTPLARKKGLQTLFRDGELPRVRSDQDKVQQILLNLVSNAVKFTEQGEVEAGVAAEGEEIRFYVRDTGIGIDKQHREHIFDEFRQVDGSTTRRHEGTGLGLAICQKLAHLLGGRIELESAPGAGSTFFLILPLRPVRDEVGEEAIPLPRTIAPRETMPKGPTLLVIDDEKAVRDLVGRHLSGAGYRVVTAGSGKEGLRLARELKPAAITLDVMMPEMDGWEVIRRLKETPDTSHIPVIIVSMSDDRGTGMALGASGYVVKPVDKNLLLAEVAKLASRRPLRRILVVDDDPVSLTRVQSILNERDFQVETAGGGAEGLERAVADPPDALILDLMMPEMDGFTVLERLRGQPTTQNLPVIILTAKDLTAADRTRLQRAVNRVITKGRMDPDQLLREIENALKGLEAGKRAEVPGEQPRVLVVEDNPVAVLQIRSALEESGYAVDVADGGARALECVAANIPDGIVLDLMMPEIDGFQVLEEIRSTERTATIPVLVLTAKELTPADRARLSHNNVQQLVRKGSLDRDQLVACVDRFFKPKEPERIERPAAAPSAEWETMTEDRPKPSGRGPILVVEDNPDNRLTISALLENAGQPYLTVEDGGQAVAAAAEHRPSLILMDMQLPVLSGLEATRRIKADPTLRDIPVIALTAKAMKGDREAILAGGCDDYLSKPLDPAALGAMISKWIGRNAE